jgi:hypothetical protein
VKSRSCQRHYSRTAEFHKNAAFEWPYRGIKLSVVAALLSVVLFVAFAGSGAQKIIFSPATSKAAEHLRVTKRNFQRIGVVEVIGAVGVLVGVVASRGSLLGVINEIGAAGLAIMMGLAVGVHRRIGDRAKYFTPALALGTVALVELIVRLA